MAARLKRYYVALSSPDEKVSTLLELMLALEQDNKGLVAAICCR